MNVRNNDAGAGRALDRVQAVLLITIAVAWPWEIFQRLPIARVTLAKVAGSLVILIAAFRLFRNGMAGTVLRGAVARGTIRAAAHARLGKLPRTGLEAPLALFAVACLLSATHSIDDAASLAELKILVSYALLFYAVVLLVPRPEDAAFLGRAFAVSAFLVGLLALACAAGYLAPAKVAATRELGRRVTTDMRAGALMRMVATAPDFNQGVLAILLAVPMALFLFSSRRMRWVPALIVAVLFAAIVVAFSRSAMAAAVLILLVFAAPAARRRFGAWKTAAVILAAVALVAIAGHAYTHAVITRALRGLATRDASYETRWYGFTVAWSLIPKYGLLGAGIGASDTAVEAVADPVRLAGTTLHSVPFKYLLETGILGLIAYGWFWAALCAQAWRHLVASEEPGRRRLGLTCLGVCLASFIMLAVQPFTTLSVFPLVFGLIFGPVAAARTRTPNDSVSPRWADAAIAALLVALVVVPNVVTYQKVCGHVSQFADTLDLAPAAERSGDWPRANQAYAAADAVAVANDSLVGLPYYRVAAAVAELDFIYDQMRIGYRDVTPRAACAYGLGRVSHARGAFADAAKRFAEALDFHPAFADARFALAEALWNAGQFREAVEAYARAASDEADPANVVYRARTAGLDSRIGVLEGSRDPAARVEAARLLRQRGRWGEAVAMCERMVDADATGAEAHFILGVNEEVQGHPAQAGRRYRQALQSLPNHCDAARRRAALSGQ